MGNRANSIQSLGGGYVNDFFQGAMILDKPHNRLLRVMGASSNSLTVSTLALDADPLNARWSGRYTEVSMEALGITTFSSFSWPKMGYRNTPCTVLDNAVWFLQTNRGTGRGLREESINREVLGIFATMQRACPNTWTPNCFAANSAARALAVYNPKWYSFKEGMTKLREGQWLGFALNEDLAITLAHQSQQAMGYDVYFRGTYAGSISEEGHLMMKNKALSRAALQKLIYEEGA